MKRYIRAATQSNNKDFVIENGVLKEYNGTAENVVIPDGVTHIYDDAFTRRENIQSVVIPDSVTSIGRFAFEDCTGLTSVTIGNSVTSIGNWAFSGCTGLTSITIPNSVTSIGEYVFYNCTSLSSITIPDSVTSIGMCAFKDCTGLTSVTIPDSVTSIGDWAFYNCTGLTSITIGNSVTSIGNYAFYGCPCLTSELEQYIEKTNGNNMDEYDDSDDYSAQDNDDYDDDYDDITFEDWYNSGRGESDGIEFVNKLEDLVRQNYDVEEFFEEPSVQGYQGGDFIWITLSDGSKYEFHFDWNTEQESIYENGPEYAAKSYFIKIQEGIDSGSALTED